MINLPITVSDNLYDAAAWNTYPIFGEREFQDKKLDL